VTVKESFVAGPSKDSPLRLQMALWQTPVQAFLDRARTKNFLSNEIPRLRLLLPKGVDIEFTGVGSDLVLSQLTVVLYELLRDSLRVLPLTQTQFRELRALAHMATQA